MMLGCEAPEMFKALIHFNPGFPLAWEHRTADVN